jgi:hypothetical protein
MVKRACQSRLLPWQSIVMPSTAGPAKTSANAASST